MATEGKRKQVSIHRLMLAASGVPTGPCQYLPTAGLHEFKLACYTCIASLLRDAVEIHLDAERKKFDL
jgi:hypothetical protein